MTDPSRPGPGTSPYLGLRAMVLSQDPGQVGIHASARFPRAWGVLSEFGMEGGTATVVSLADGTTSLYASSGSGIIGGGGHPQVVEATLALLDQVERDLEAFTPVGETPLPGNGRVAFVALTHGGVLRAEADADDLAHGLGPLAGIFRAANEVLTRLRLIGQPGAAGE